MSVATRLAMIRLSTRKRLTLLGIIIVVAIAAGTGLVISMQRDVAFGAYRSGLANLAYGMSRQTDYLLSGVDGALQTIQEGLIAPDAPGKQSLDAALQSPAAYDLLNDQLERISAVDALVLVAADGEIVNGAGDSPMAANLSGQDYFSHFKSNDDPGLFVGMPLQNSTGAWIVPMARRIDAANGAFAGVVVAELSLAELAAFYQLAMPMDRVLYLTRDDGVVLLSYPAQAGDIGRRIPPDSLWYATVAKGGGVYHGPAFFDPDLVVAAVTPLDNLPLAVAASVSQAVALRQWRRDSVWDVLGGFFAAFCAIGLLKLFARQFDRIETSERILLSINAELDLAHRQLEATIANLPQGVCFFDADKKLLVFNQRFCQLIGLPCEIVRAGMSAAELAELRMARGAFVDQSAEEVLATLDAWLRAGLPVDEIVTLTDGRTISKHFEPLPGHGWVTTYEDISERRAAEEKITYLAHHDLLTGLANRALLRDRLAEVLAAPVSGAKFALLCLDLDRFKAVNDTYGHRVGDSLLRAVADRLRAEVRAGDTIARMGGDEFVILQINAPDLARTTALAGRIIETIGAPFEIEGHRLNIGVSIGIVMAPSRRMAPEPLLQQADIALYRSKQEGRGTWRMFEPEMEAMIAAAGTPEGELINALPLDQLELHYQPIVSGKQRGLAGFEALLRWNHPGRGMLAAAEFITLAEQIGATGDIAAWVLQQACAEAMTWPGEIRVAVNLSAREFAGERLVPIVREALQTSGLPPGRLELEVTESVPLLNDPRALQILGQVRGLGVRIALADFGTGFSTLTHLRSFPFDAVKIDRSLVSALETHGEYRAIIQGLIGLATHLGMKIIAEGVETEAQFNVLVGAGCDEIQGFWVGRPAPAAELAGIMESIAAEAGALAGRREFVHDGPERRTRKTPATQSREIRRVV